MSLTAADTPSIPSTSTVDPQEARRFDRLAATWWDPAGPMWPLHKLNALRAPYVTEQIAGHFHRDAAHADALAGLQVLDIGCGAGLLTEALARRGAAVTGIDIAERNIIIASEHARAGGLTIDYRCAAAEGLDEGDFDVVLNMEVVEHVANLPAFMAHACRLTAPGGLMVVATLNRTLRAFVAAILGAEYMLGWLPRGTHSWGKFVKPAELSAMLEEHGMQRVADSGVSINPLTRRYSLSRNLSINYMLVATRPASAATA